MPISRARAIGRSVGAVTALLAIALGVPVLLIAFAGWPLPSSVPVLGSVWTRLQQGDVPAESVLKSIAVAVWLIWLQLMWAIVWEVAVNARRVADRRPPRRAPFTPTPVSVGIGRLVAMVFSASVVVASLPVPSLAQAPAVVVTDQSPTTRSAPSVARNVAAPSEAPCWAVQSADTLWKISEAALGDGARSNEIIDLNDEIRSARDVRPGQRLVLPADAAIPNDRQSSPVAATPEVETSGFVAEAAVVIEQGDTLWGLSTARLAAARGEAPEDVDVVEYVDDVVERNLDVVEDPDLIYPGEVFVMPAIGTEPLPPPTSTPEPPPRADASTADATDDQAPPREPQQPSNPPRTEHAVPSSSPIVLEKGPHHAPAPIGDTSATSTPTASESEVDPTDSSLSPWALAVGTSTTLATGLLLLRRRRQRLASVRGARGVASDPSNAHVESELVRAADVPLLTWARHELSSLFARTDLGPTAGVPIAVEICSATGIEVLWSEPNRAAPRPWDPADDGWTWRATYDDDIEIPASASPSPLPGLVTIGARDGRDLLINLEAFGALDLVGDRDAVSDLARSMVAELSTDEILADTYVHVVGDQFDDLPLTLRRLSISGEDARSLLDGTAAEHSQLLDDAGVHSAFALRRSLGGIGREVAAVVVEDDEGAAALRGSALPNRGVGLIVVGSAATEGTHVLVHADGSAELLPLGICFTAASLPVGTAGGLTELIELDVECEPKTAEDTELDDARELALVESPSSIGDVSDDEPEEPPAPPEVLVTVLGRPMVAEFPQLGRMDTNLVVFLAANGGQATDGQLIDAVWNGRMVEQGTVWNRISKVRSIVGPRLPARASGDDKVKLSPCVGTDLDYFAALVDYADDGSSDEAIELLSDALELIAGPPFDAPGYDWAYQQQHHSRACDLIESTAIRLVDLALDAGALGVARRGVAQALKALPANEPLYRARMRLELAADNPSGVVAAFDELSSLLAEMSEAGLEFEPSMRTVRLRADLLDAASSARSA